ncbi:uncharacterized protein METZ01_LOCUS86294, partial [marine metagenome]
MAKIESPQGPGRSLRALDKNWWLTGLNGRSGIILASSLLEASRPR